MNEEVMRVLGPGEVFFDYGPVSMVVCAQRQGRGDTELCTSAFPVIDRTLMDLGRHLEALRQFPANVDPSALTGPALTMAQAALGTGDPLLTPMAAVAGTVADTVADYLQNKGAEKATANNGGDVALRLGPGQSLRLGLLYDLAKGGVDEAVTLTPDKSVGGVATSGLGGRSLTTGIASGVTVFARRCAEADALATLLADRSYIASPAVHTRLARDLDPDSDIAALPVVVGLGPLTEVEKARSLRQVLEEAQRQYDRGSLLACVATVQGRTEHFDPLGILNG